jgi:hypothetical protein
MVTAAAFDTHGCPIRLDIVRLETRPDDHDCWPGLGTIRFGTPFGTSTDRTASRTYIRDPNRLLHLRLRLDAADDTVIYVVTGEAVEAWPHHDEPFLCA